MNRLSFRSRPTHTASAPPRPRRHGAPNRGEWDQASAGYLRDAPRFVARDTRAGSHGRDKDRELQKPQLFGRLSENSSSPPPFGQMTRPRTKPRQVGGRIVCGDPMFGKGEAGSPAGRFRCLDRVLRCYGVMDMARPICGIGCAPLRRSGGGMTGKRPPSIAPIASARVQTKRAGEN